MGSVYLGRDPQLDRAVAIKTVRNLDLEEKRLQTFLERFRNEARAAARLSHPAIVAVYDVGEDPNVGPYLVFEYVPGSTLKQIVRARGALAPAEAIKLGRQLAAALDTAHAAGVIHRDIKPDNILVSDGGDAKLADFGVARVPDAALTREGQFLGTPCYAAPETLDQGRYGAHSDLFSFAAVLYEALTAMRAFPGDDAISVAHHVVHDDPKVPSEVAPSVGIPREVDRVIMRALSKNPDARYPTGSALILALEDAYVAAGLLEKDPTGVQALPVAERPSEGRSGGWVFALVLAGGLAVGVALVAAFGDFDDGLFGGDDTVLDAGLAPLLDAGAPASAEEDDGLIVPVAIDAGPRDAGIDAGARARESEEDAGVAGMSAFEREEAAKDHVDRARQRLEAGDIEAAQRELTRARALDSGNADIPDLEQRIAAAQRAE